jgi:hypothetical protein
MIMVNYVRVSPGWSRRRIWRARAKASGHISYRKLVAVREAATSDRSALPAANGQQRSKFGLFQDGSANGSAFCSEVLPPASSRSPMRLLTCAHGRLWRPRFRECIPGGQGVAGSNPAVPTGQRLVPGFSYQFLAATGARALPSTAPAKRSGVPCRASILTSDYWQSARPAGWFPPFPRRLG